MRAKWSQLCRSAWSSMTNCAMPARRSSARLLTASALSTEPQAGLIAASKFAYPRLVLGIHGISVGSSSAAGSLKKQIRRFAPALSGCAHTLDLKFRSLRAAQRYSMRSYRSVNPYKQRWRPRTDSANPGSLHSSLVERVIRRATSQPSFVRVSSQFVVAIRESSAGYFRGHDRELQEQVRAVTESGSRRVLRCLRN